MTSQLLIQKLQPRYCTRCGKELLDYTTYQTQCKSHIIDNLHKARQLSSIKLILRSVERSKEARKCSAK